jgi:hypothetical protein
MIFEGYGRDGIRTLKKDVESYLMTHRQTLETTPNGLLFKDPSETTMVVDAVISDDDDDDDDEDDNDDNDNDCNIDADTELRK